MKKRVKLVIVFSALLALGLSIVNGAIHTEVEAQSSVEKYIISAEHQTANDLLNQVDGAKHLENVGVVIAEVSEDQIEDISGRSGVYRVVKDVARKPQLLDSIGFAGIDTIQQQGYDGSGAAIAIFDNGIDSTHQMFAGKNVTEACFSTTSFTVSSLCPNGLDQQFGPGSANASNNCSGIGTECTHGWHVAGIAAGDAPSLQGVAPNADIIALQVFSKVSSSTVCEGQVPCVLVFDSDVLEGINYIISLQNNTSFTSRIVAANMSLGLDNYSSQAQCNADPAASLYIPAFNTLVSNGILPVVASGNSGSSNSVAMPACIESAIAVGSVNATGYTDGGSVNEVAGDVSFFTDSNELLDIMAPGALISSAGINNTLVDRFGTSMAAPHVAGMLALMHQQNPGASAEELRSALLSGSSSILDSRNNLTFPLLNGNSIIDTMSLRTWDGGGQTSNWSDPANWTNNISPGPKDRVVFNSTSSKDVFFDEDINSLQVDFQQSYGGTVGSDDVTMRVYEDLVIPSGSNTQDLSLIFLQDSTLNPSNNEFDIITAASGELTITDSLRVNSFRNNATTNAPSGVLFIDSNFNNQGLFNAGIGMVDISGVNTNVVGNTTFNNVRISGAGTTSFEAGSTQVIDGVLLVGGGSESSLRVLRSSVEGQQFLIDPPSGSALSFVDLIDATSVAPAPTVISSSFDGGGNTNWSFADELQARALASTGDEGGDSDQTKDSTAEQLAEATNGAEETSDNTAVATLANTGYKVFFVGTIGLLIMISLRVSYNLVILAQPID